MRNRNTDQHIFLTPTWVDVLGVWFVVGGEIKKNLWPLFYGCGSTTSRLEPLRGGSLLFTTKFPDIPGTHFTDLGRMKGRVDLGATQWF